MQRIKELDGMRAVAILLVLGCHYVGFSSLLGGLPEMGWIGVDLFFVLSGFLITRILLGLRGREHAYRTFYVRRTIRILPPYVAVTVVLLIAALFVRDHLVLSASFLVKQVFFLQGLMKEYFGFLRDFLFHLRWYAIHPPNLMQYAHTLPLGAKGPEPELMSSPLSYWSLSVEEYFYILWAPVVLHCARRSVVWIGMAVCVAEMILRGYYPNALACFGLFFRFDSLLYGAFLALFLARWKDSTSYPKGLMPAFSGLFFFALGGLAMILFAIRPVVGFDVRNSPLVRVAGLPLLAVAATAMLGMLCLRANSSWWLARLLRTRPLQLIGTISYTMYLVHLLVNFLLIEAFARRFSWWTHGSRLPQAVINSLVTIALARLSWHYLEKPMLRWKDRHFPATHLSEPALD